MLILVLIGSVWMTLERDRCSRRRTVHVNNFNIYKALDARARGHSVKLSMTRYNDTMNVQVSEKPNARADQTGAMGRFRMFIRFQSGFWYRCQTRSRRGPSQHRSCRSHVLLHCMGRNCHWDEEMIRKRV